MMALDMDSATVPVPFPVTASVPATDLSVPATDLATDLATATAMATVVVPATAPATGLVVMGTKVNFKKEKK